MEYFSRTCSQVIFRHVKKYLKKIVAAKLKYGVYKMFTISVNLIIKYLNQKQ